MADLRPQRLLSVGSIVADVRIDVPHLPERGGDVIGLSAVVTAGGGVYIPARAGRHRPPPRFPRPPPTGALRAPLTSGPPPHGRFGAAAPQPRAPRRASRC